MKFNYHISVPVDVDIHQVDVQPNGLLSPVTLLVIEVRQLVGGVGVVLLTAGKGLSGLIWNLFIHDSMRWEDILQNLHNIYRKNKISRF